MKKQYVIPMFACMMLLMAGMVMAADTPTLNTPAASAEISGATYTVNVTLDSNTLSITNATFYYKTSSGSWTEIANVENTTADQTEWTTTFDSTALVDQTGMTFNVTMANATATIADDTSATVVIDNGDPTAAFSSGTTADLFSILTTDTFTVGSAADSTIGISNCTVTMNGVTSDITDVTANACDDTSFSPSTFSITTDGDYTYTLTVTDANSDTDVTSSRTLNVLVAPGGGANSGSSTDTNPDDATVQDGDDSSTSEPGAIARFFKGIRDTIKKVIDAIVFWK